MNNFRVATMKAVKNQLNSPNSKVQNLCCEINQQKYFTKVKKFNNSPIFLHQKLDFYPKRFVQRENYSNNQKSLLTNPSIPNLLIQSSFTTCSNIGNQNSPIQRVKNQKMSLEQSKKSIRSINPSTQQQSIEAYYSTLQKNLIQNENCFIKNQGNKIIINPKNNLVLFDHLTNNQQLHESHEFNQKHNMTSTQARKEISEKSIRNKNLNSKDNRQKKTIFGSPAFLRNRLINIPPTISTGCLSKRPLNCSYSAPKKYQDCQSSSNIQLLKQDEQHPLENRKNKVSKRSVSSQKCLKFHWNQILLKPNFKQKKGVNHNFELGQQVCLKIFNQQHKIRRAFLKVIKKLAQNGANSVYLVAQRFTGFIFCLKKCSVKLSQYNSSDVHQFPNFIDYLIRESKIGIVLDHPFLIKTYCTLYDDSNIYQLMQFVQGSSLFSHNEQRRRTRIIDCKNQRLFHSIKQIKQIISELLQGLIYLHNKKIVHRDIKPANIFISNNHAFKIGDFGCSIYQSPNDFVGTLDYVSPEILNHHIHGYPVDMWAIGCIAYELYTGRPPFYHFNRDITIQRIVQCKYNIMKIQDLPLRSFIQRLLQKQPEKRMSSKEAYQHPFINEFKHLRNQC